MQQFAVQVSRKIQQVRLYGADGSRKRRTGTDIEHRAVHTSLIPDTDIGGIYAIFKPQSRRIRIDIGRGETERASYPLARHDLAAKRFIRFHALPPN